MTDKMIPVPKGLLEALVELLDRADTSEGYCCCGDSMQDHPDPMYCGHSPVDAGDYYAGQRRDELKTLLREAAPQSQDREDALRYRFIRSIVSASNPFGRGSWQFHYDRLPKPLNNPMKGVVAQNFDEAIDHARAALAQNQGDGKLTSKPEKKKELMKTLVQLLSNKDWELDDWEAQTITEVRTSDNWPIGTRHNEPGDKFLEVTIKLSKEAPINKET